MYPYEDEGLFAICQNNYWHYIVTFKEGNLSTVWEETRELQKYQIKNQHQESITRPDGNTEVHQYRWVEGVDHRGYRINWLECKECITKNKKGKKTEETQCTFTHLTDLPVNTGNIVLTSRTGRLRWKIENEGFNTLKNGGYKIEHKYSRVNYQASKNYYQLMQIALLVNQLMVLSCQFHTLFLMSENHPVLKSLWQDLTAAMKWAKLDVKKLQKINRQKIQCRFIS